MALSATPTSSFSASSTAGLAHEFSQPTPAPHHHHHQQLKRRHSDVQDDKEDGATGVDTRSSIASGLKKLRLAPRLATKTTTTTAIPTSGPPLPNSSAFPSSQPAYLQPHQSASVRSPLNLSHSSLSTPAKGPLSPFLSPGHWRMERDSINTPPPAAFASASSSRTSTWTDSMMLDNPVINIDTPNRVVINDLDAELAEIDAEEEQERRREQERLFFLPDDVEKQVSAIPAEILRQTSSPAIQTPAPSQSQALILYKEPPSLGLPPHDVDDESEPRQRLRMAKQRIRQLRSESALEPEPLGISSPPTTPPPLQSPAWGGQGEITMHSQWSPSAQDEDVQDEDAMDIE